MACRHVRGRVLVRIAHTTPAARPHRIPGVQIASIVDECAHFRNCAVMAASLRLKCPRQGRMPIRPTTRAGHRAHPVAL